MAKVQFGPNVTAVSGTIGNVVYSTWKGKPYVRTRPPVVSNPQTEDQNRQREAVSNGGKKWKGTTLPDEKKKWEEYANQKGSEVDQMRKSHGGQGIIDTEDFNMSGFNAFLGCVLERESVGYTHREHIMTDAPKGKPKPGSPTGLSAEYENPTPKFKLSFFAPIEPGPSYEYTKETGEVVVQPTVMRVWIKPPNALIKIAAIVPIKEPGALHTCEITGVKILDEIIPIWPGRYRFQVDCVSGHGQRSGPSNLEFCEMPGFCQVPDITGPDVILEYVAELGEVIVGVKKTVLDAECQADFLKVWFYNPGTEVWTSYFFPRLEWIDVELDYAVHLPTGVLPPETYMVRVQSGTLAGSRSNVLEKELIIPD